MGKRWTDKEDNTLAALRYSGMPNSEIASSMGRSTQAIYQRTYVLRRNEPTFREVVDTAFANSKYITPKEAHEYIARRSAYARHDEVGQRLSDIATSVQKNKPKPQWWKAMMWWRK